MKKIVWDLQDLKDRVGVLRSLRSQYEDCQLKLHQTMVKTQEVYQLDGSPLFTAQLNLASSLQSSADQLEKLAVLLETHIEELENASRD